MTDDELDKRYDEIVARYPDGLTGVQFRQIALESADENGRIYPHPVAPLDSFRLLMRMFIDGHIENRGGGYDKPFKWYITEKGRDFIAIARDRSGEQGGDGMSEKNPYTAASPFDQILCALQIWRNMDRADKIEMSRNDVITIIEGVRALRMREIEALKVAQKGEHSNGLKEIS